MAPYKRDNDWKCCKTFDITHSPILQQGVAVMFFPQ